MNHRLLEDSAGESDPVTQGAPLCSPGRTGLEGKQGTKPGLCFLFTFGDNTVKTGLQCSYRGAEDFPLQTQESSCQGHSFAGSRRARLLLGRAELRSSALCF